MNLKQVLFIFFVLIVHCRCNPSYCNQIDIALESISFSIMDSNGNDLIDSDVYDSFFIELRTADNEKIRLDFQNTTIPERMSLSNRNTSLETLNNSDLFLHLSSSDIDTIRMNVTEMFDMCDYRYYESNSFTHNGILLNESTFSNHIEPHFILIKE